MAETKAKILDPLAEGFGVAGGDKFLCISIAEAREFLNDVIGLADYYAGPANPHVDAGVKARALLAVIEEAEDG